MLARARALSLILCLAFTVACDRGIFQFDVSGNVEDGGGDGSDASDEIDAGPFVPIDADTTPDACVPKPEICDNDDNDCDGNVDEGIDLTSDPNNCGVCGNACNLLQFHALGSCVASTCEFQCQSGFVDLDDDLQTDPTDPDFDGCEYFCVPTNGSVEACDLVDNDCNGQVDETFDLQNDESNCGTCGKVCQTLNATPECQAGTCGFEPGSCTPGFLDLDGNTGNGCEYDCPVFSGVTCNGDGDCNGAIGETCINGFCIEPETCDGEDDDCDGVVDGPTVVGLGQPCDPPDCGNGICSDVGQCVRGVQSCFLGTLLCENAVGPQADICDGFDNDCDGTPDQDFNLQADPNNCGTCGLVCLNQPGFDHVAVPNCSAGACGIVQCAQGFVDVDGDPANGCEYQCTPNGTEVCDGVDNDCDCPNEDTNGDGTVCGHGDTNVDELDNNPPEVFFQPANFCRQEGACSGDPVGSAIVTPVCAPGTGPVPCDNSVENRCFYDGSIVDLDQCGDILPSEQRCDGLDNNCNNVADETFPLLDGNGQPRQCFEDGQFPNTPVEFGACRGSGFVACNQAEDGVECNITDPGATATAESCNNIDDDCDQTTDEESLDLTNDTIDVGTYRVFKYEASRPDAGRTCLGGDNAGAPCVNDGDCPGGGACFDLAGAVSNSVACSKQGVLPWTLVTYDEAVAACDAINDPVSGAPFARLCTEAQWELACAGTDGSLYPYNDVIQGCLGGPKFGSQCVGGTEPPDTQCLNDGDCFGGGTCTLFTCTVDNDCGGSCLGGADEGTACTPPTDTCADTCIGGDNPGGACTSDNDCLGTSVPNGVCDFGSCVAFTCGDVYDPLACNGRDFGVCNTGPAFGQSCLDDAQCGGAQGSCDLTQVAFTGEATVCAGTEFAAFDMSGNVKEWTDTPVGPNNFRVRGGAFDNVEEGLTCEFDFVSLNRNNKFPNLGFRCCTD